MEKHPILLDTNAYLRLAKRVRPLLGQAFGRKNYELWILGEVEKEVMASRRLRRTFPWFSDDEHKDERLAKALRLKPQERKSVNQTTQFLVELVAQEAWRFIADGGSPPGETDCYVLAVAIEFKWSLVRNATRLDTKCQKIWTPPPMDLDSASHRTGHRRQLSWTLA